MIIGIYAIINVVTGYRYIGSSKMVLARFSAHAYNLQRGKHENLRLQCEWNKYGEACFAFELVEIVNNETMLFQREQFYLDTLQNLYNINTLASRPPSRKGCSHPSKGKPRDPDIIERGRLKRVGQKRTPEQCARIRAGNLAKPPVSEETKKKLSEIAKGKNTWSKGCTQSSESNIKRSAALKGKKRPPEVIEKLKEYQQRPENRKFRADFMKEFQRLKRENRRPYVN